MGKTKHQSRASLIPRRLGLLLLVMLLLGGKLAYSQNCGMPGTTLQAGEKFRLEEITKITKLRMLDKDYVDSDDVLYLSDADYEQLHKASSLEGLFVDGFVSNDWLRHLVPLENLKCIELQATGVDSGAAKYLRRMRHLHTLDLRKTRFGDQGLAVLARSKSIRVLYLDETLVTDFGVSRIPLSNQYELLSLASTRITDKSAIRLSQLREIGKIDVSETMLTVDGIRLLLHKVGEIEFDDLVTQDVVEELKREFPNVVINASSR